MKVSDHRLPPHLPDLSISSGRWGADGKKFSFLLSFRSIRASFHDSPHRRLSSIPINRIFSIPWSCIWTKSRQLKDWFLMIVRCYTNKNIRTQVRETTYANSQTLNTDFLCRRSIPFQPMKCLHEHGQLMKRTHFAWSNLSNTQNTFALPQVEQEFPVNCWFHGMEFQYFPRDWQVPVCDQLHFNLGKDTATKSSIYKYIPTNPSCFALNKY